MKATVYVSNFFLISISLPSLSHTLSLFLSLCLCPSPINFHSLTLSMSHSLCLSNLSNLSIYSSIYLSLYLFIYLSIYLSLHLLLKSLHQSLRIFRLLCQSQYSILAGIHIYTHNLLTACTISFEHTA